MKRIRVPKTIVRRRPLGLAASAACCALTLAACGGSPMHAEQAPGRAETCSETTELSDCEERLRGLEQELNTALPAAGDREPGEPPLTPPPPHSLTAGTPDCDAGRELRDRICELAESICALAARPAAAAQTVAACDSSRASCERARTRVADTCP